MKFAAAVLVTVLMWAAMNHLIWRWTAASVQRMAPSEARPWNWRVLVGALAYYPWLNRREQQTRPHPVVRVLPSPPPAPPAPRRLK